MVTDSVCSEPMRLMLVMVRVMVVFLLTYGLGQSSMV